MTTEELLQENNRMRNILRAIAYPRRGTAEAVMNIQDAANIIQGIWRTADDLAHLEPDTNLENLEAAHARMWHREAIRLSEKYGEHTFYN